MDLGSLSEYYGLFASGIGIGALLGAFFWLVGYVISVFVSIFSRG